jgi:ribonuclease D
VGELAEKHNLPPENLITPDLVRRVSWEPPANPTAENVGAALRALGARQWQVDLVAPVLAGAFVRAATQPAEQQPAEERPEQPEP